MKIKAIRVRAVAAPMKRPLHDQHRLGHASRRCCSSTCRPTHGIVGRSYLFALGKHNLAPIAKLVEAMAEMVKGDAVAPFDLERKLRARYALLGVHNIVLFAMSGIDMAAWDALGAGARPAAGAPARRRAAADSRPTTPTASASCR